MEIFKRHFETLTILGGMAIALITCCMWMNGKFSAIDQRLVRIETVLIMQGIMPKELAIKKECALEKKS